MRIALINSGIGLLAPAAALHRMRPDADLILAPDPDGMPWGPRTPDDIAARALLCARATLRYQPDIMIMACNTGSVHALDAMRAEFEPAIPVIGTVPAIKPAAAAHHTVAIWATVATTASAYQRRLIAEFGGSAEVTPVACPGLADAVDAGDEAATAAAVAAAAAQTPAGCEVVVLGCTEYELVADQITQAIPGAVTFGSAIAVAAQALRRIPGGAGVGQSASAGPASDDLAFHGPGAARLASGVLASDGPASNGPASGDPAAGDPAAGDPIFGDPAAGSARLGTVRVLLSGRPAALPPAALSYAEGRLLAPLVLAISNSELMASSPVGG
jgi:glutamate racemase